MSAWDHLPTVSDAPPKASGDTPPDTKKSPWESLPTVTAPTAAPTAPPISAGAAMMRPIKEIGPDIWHEIHSGLDTLHDAMKRSGKDAQTGLVSGEMAGPEAALGAAQVASAVPLGAYKALVSEPLKRYFRNTVGTALSTKGEQIRRAEGKLPAQAIDPHAAKVAVDTIANTLDDTVLMFGPEAIGPYVNAVKTAAGPVRKLLERGVQLTPGQMVPAFAKRLEEAAKSLPVVGSFVRAAEERSLDSFNVATINHEVLQPTLGVTVDANTSREALIKAHDIADQKYEEVRRGIPILTRDHVFDRDVAMLRQDLDEMNPQVKQRMEAVLNNRVMSKWDSQYDVMSGDNFKKTDSELAMLARQARGSADQADRDFGNKIAELRGILRDTVGRQFPKIKPKLDDIDKAYALLTNIDIAASRRATAGGRFTPSDLLETLKRTDKSPRHMKFNEASKPMQQWAESAHKVMANKLPDSGTFERAAWGAELLTGALATPKYLMGLAGTAAAYNPVSQRLLGEGVLAAPGLARDAGALAVRAAPVAAAKDQSQAQP